MAQPTREQLVAAFQRADAAQDVEAATELARRIRALDQGAPMPAGSAGPRTELGTSPNFERPAQPAPLPPMGQAEAEGMTGLEQFMAGFGSAYARPVRGVGQMLGLRDEGEVQRLNEMDESLMNTGWGFTGNLAGNVASLVGPGLALKGIQGMRALTAAPSAVRGVEAALMAPQVQNAAGVASRAFLPNTIAGATVQGGALGAAQPISEGDSRALNAGFGAGFGFVGQASPRTIGSVGRVLNARGRAADVIRESVPNADAIIGSGAPSATPGVTRTLAEETLDPGVVALDRGARAAGQGATFANREAANAAAQIEALRKIAGTEDDLLRAMSARDTASAPLRAQALKEQAIDVTEALSSLGKIAGFYRGNPTVQGPINRAQQLIANVSREGPRDPLAMSGQRGAPIADMRQLYNVRKEIANMIAGTSPDVPQGQAIARELITTRDALDRVIARRVPAFREYLNTYKSMSGDVNQLQFGQELLRVSTRGADEIAPNLLQGGFIAATEGIDSGMRRAGVNRLAQRATGFGRAQARTVASPEQLQTIRSLRDDILRTQEVNRLGTRIAGNNSATASNETAKRRLVETIVNLSPATNIVLRMLEGKAQERVAIAVADALANPNQARAILSRFPAGERRAAQQVFNGLGIATSAQATAMVPMQ